MAAAPKKQESATTLLKKPSRKRPGIHSKKKAAKIKSSKNYKKVYRGQGR